MELIFPTVIIILGCVALLLLLQWKNLREPPCIRGWIPWIGAGFEFGKAPLEFIEKARIKYGPIFTVFAMGTRMTFVTEEEGINVFLKSKEVNFELAVQNPIYRTASIPKNIFFALHEKLYIVMKGKLGTFNLCQFAGQLTEELHEQLENLGTHGTIDLNNLVRHLLYPVSVNMLFKKGLFPTNKKKIMEFHQYFRAYDEGFEHGSQVPECLLRNWSKSKRWLLAFFEKNIPDIKTYKSEKDNSMTLMQDLLNVIETETNEESPNYGLLLLWASLSNAVTIAFWTLGFVLSHPNIHRTIMEGISSVFGTAGKDKIKVSEDDLKKLPLIRWCILETTRLRAPGAITRKVLKPVKILNYTVPSGDLLMLSPFWLHRNPKYFPEPESFKPERWKKANLEKHVFLDSFMAFGSGKYQCPGRSVRQLGHIYPESLWKDDGTEGESFGLLFLFFTIKLQGKPGDHILLGWPVVLCNVYMRMSKGALIGDLMRTKYYSSSCQVKAGFMLQMLSFPIRIIQSGLNFTFFKDKDNSVIFL